MNKMMILLLYLIMTTSAFAHEDPKKKLVFGKKCTFSNNVIVSSYVWVVEKNSDWKQEINKKNCQILKEEIKLLPKKKPLITSN